MAKLTRREALAFAASVAAPGRSAFPSFLDPLTEAVVTRLTPRDTEALLPSVTNSFISQKGRWLAFSRRQGMGWEPCLLDLRTGGIIQLAETSKLDPLSLTFDTNARNVLFLDGGVLYQVSISSRRRTKLAESVDAFSAHGTVFVLRGSRIEDLTGRVRAADVSGLGPVSPNGQLLLFKRGAELWYAQGTETKLLLKSPSASPFWSAESAGVFYLDRSDPVRSVLRVISVDGTISEVANTTQFAVVSPKRDDSVFVGASASKAQPAVILLLPQVRREFVLCEHRATNAAGVRPTFSPDSRNVYFQTDRSGQSAIYRVSTEHLVEPT